MRRAPRIDANHAAIVEALREHPGVSVQSLAGVANGCPDLLVGVAGSTYVVEVKDGDKPLSHRSFTPDQVTWIEQWNGSPVVVLMDCGKARSWVARVGHGGRLATLRMPDRPMAVAGR